MKMSDIVFTDHAIKRMRERGISGEWAFQTVKFPDNMKPGKEKHTTEFLKRFDSRTLTAIAKKNDIGEWVVLSAWIDPPFPGTDDHKERESYFKKLKRNSQLDRKMENAGFWRKLWLTFKKQTGL